MSHASASRTRRIVSRITAAWADMDHAQRRMFEIQTGITGPTRDHGRRTRVQDNAPDAQL
jgi:hypothetical protein